MNKEHIHNVLQFKPSGFDPYVEQHREDGDSLEYTSWDKFQQQEHVDERSVLPNEVVIDIDEGDTDERRDKTRQVCTLLQGLPYFVADTGGTGFHIHVFFQVPSNIDEAHDLRSYRMALFDWIRDRIDEEAAFSSDALDVAPVDFDTATSKGHLIRAVGGRHSETGHRKTKVTPSSLDKPEVKDAEEVDYPVLDKSTDFIRMSKLDSKNADLSWSEVQNAAAEYQEKTEERREKQLETDYEAADNGLDAVRQLPADEVLKLLGRDVPRGQEIKCPCHDDNNPSAKISDGTEAEEVEPGLLFCWSGCVEDGESGPHVNNAIDILRENGYSFQEAMQELADEFDVDLEDDEDDELDMDKLHAMMQEAVDEDNPVKTAKKRREVFKRVVQVHHGDDDIQQEILNHIHDEFDVSKKDLRESLEKARENSESGEPGEPSEPGEPGSGDNEDSEREGVPDNQEDLLETLEESDRSESIRMSGITPSGVKIHTTFLELSGELNEMTVEPVSFLEDENGNRHVQRTKSRLQEKQKELLKEARDEDEIPRKLTAKERQQLDYRYLEVNGTEIMFDPKPSRDDPSTKTPDSGIVDYYKGNDTVDDDLFQQIRSFVSDHWYHFNKEWYDILAAWIIHTYFLQDLVVTPYIFFTGKKGTGKTQAQRVLDKLSYHSIRHEQSTPASVERCVSRSHATIHMDEMDDMSEEKRIRMIRTINSGYNHGATRMLVGDTDASVGEQSSVLHTYSAKTIAANGLHQFSDTVKSRAWIIDTTPKPDSVDIQDIRHPSPEKTERLQDLRNQLFWLSFDKREQVLDSIDKAKETLSVDNRQKDKISAAYGIIRYFMGEDKALEVAEFLASQSALKSEDVSKTDKAFLRVMADETGDNGIEMPLSDIADEINRKTGREDDDKFSVTPKGVGNRLREYGMIQDPEEHKPRRSDGTYAKIPAEIVREQMEVHGFSELASKVGHLSLTDDNDQESGSPGSLGSPGSPNSGDSLADNDLNRVKEAVEELNETTTGAGASHADVLDRCGSIEDKTIQDILEDDDRFYEAEAGEWRVSQ